MTLIQSWATLIIIHHMATQLKPGNSLFHDPNKVNLSTVNEERLQRIHRVREDLDHQFGEKTTKHLAQESGMAYVNLVGFAINTLDLKYMDANDVEKYKMGIFGVRNGMYFVATTNPDKNQSHDILKALEEQGGIIKLFLCSEVSLAKLHKIYLNVLQEETPDDTIEINQAEEDKGIDYDLKYIQSLIENASTSEIIQIMLTAALKNDASDIHLEPEKDIYNLRLRLDGVLHTFAKLPKEFQRTIESRIKIITKLKINVTNVPQDGRFSFYFEGKEIDVRVSMLPTNYGYSVVMRLLGTGSVNLVLEDLGFSGLAKQRVEKAINKPQGMILNTGPTGSGKTTTLYAFLNQLNNSETKIITLEDPIEYRLPGISQTQIEKEAGYTFSGGLRSILRQDPDVVMVGEIRDNETSEIAVQAALTGHLLLSTLHTNDAAGAITRLMELGIHGYMISDALSAVIGQRLLRRICVHCKQPHELDHDIRQEIQEELNKIPEAAGVELPQDLQFYTSPGCEKCNGLGYKGRIGAYEVLNVTDGLRNLLSQPHVSVQDVRKVAAQEGMVTMFQDGILKALDGITDIKEIYENISR